METMTSNRRRTRSWALPTVVFVAGVLMGSELWSQPPSSSSERSDFLLQLEGEWRMEGRFRFHAGGDWLRTGSTMTARLELGGRLLVRDVEAPQIGFEAYDLLWYDEAKSEYTYLYVNSQSSERVYRVGSATGEHEITVAGEDPPGRTVISFDGPDLMVARDFTPGADGEEWMSREVMHHRVAESGGP